MAILHYLWFLALLAGCSAPSAPPPNAAPAARLSSDQTVLLGQTVTVDGSASSDPEGTPLTYQWTAAEDNPASVPLPQSASFSFVPAAPGIYRFFLRVSDGENLSATASVAITVTGSANRPPVADAGLATLTYPLEAPAPIPLDGSASADPDGDLLTYRWTLISAPVPVAPLDSTAAQTTFTPSRSGDYIFRLTVSDGRESATDQVRIAIQLSGRPVAQAGPDQEVLVGALVTLDGSGSADPEGEPLSFRWRLKSGPPTSLSDSTAARPTFVPTTPGDYVFVLAVEDPGANRGQDEVAVRVTAPVFQERAGMIEIPAGPFVMGDDNGAAADEAPAHQVELSLFWIDKFEVTTAQYAACVEAGACAPAGEGAGCNAPLLERAEHPINCVTWEQASAYCQWAAKRLPTEAEWEKAARGTDQRRFPWGADPPEPRRLNYNNDVGATRAVGSYPDGVSPYGVHDLSGNVLEWTADYYAADYYAISPAQDPPGPPAPAEGEFRVARSSSWNIGDERALTTTVRNNFPAATADAALGLRCARTEAP